MLRINGLPVEVSSKLNTQVNIPEIVPAKVAPKHIGGGWYLMPDGRKLRKKNLDLKAGD